MQASAESDQVIRIRMSRVVVYWLKSHNMLGCCMDIENVVSSSLPCLLYGCLVCGSSFLRWSSINWWEQMGEVPAVSKEMAIPLLSHLGWTLRYFSSWVFFRATAHVLLYALLLYSLLLDFYLVSVGIVVCPVCRGCIKDPRTTLHYYFVWSLF